MKKNNNDPFINVVLSEDEQLVEQALEEDEYKDAANFEITQQLLADAAAQYQDLNTSKPITIRINQLDLIRVKAKAASGNIPYQTLLGALIHQYAEGEKTLQL